MNPPDDEAARPAAPAQARAGATRRALIAGFKLAVIAAIGVAIARRFDAELAELSALEWSREQLRPGWLAAASGLYLAGLALSAVFWQRVLVRMGHALRWSRLLPAYFLGHLGKYVPGKALVVILRVWALRGAVPPSVAAASVFYEVLTMMAVGGLVAGVALAGSVAGGGEPKMLLVALGLSAVAGLPILPPVFSRIARLLARGRVDPERLAELGAVSPRLLLEGAGLFTISWLLLGLSLWAALAAVSPAGQPELAALPALTAAVSLSVVAGFASLLPGGLGVREWVLMELLVDRVGEGALVVAAVLLLRIVWIAGEVLATAILYTGARMLGGRQ